MTISMAQYLKLRSPELLDIFKWTEAGAQHSPLNYLEEGTGKCIYIDSATKLTTSVFVFIKVKDSLLLFMGENDMWEIPSSILNIPKPFNKWAKEFVNMKYGIDIKLDGILRIVHQPPIEDKGTGFFNIYYVGRLTNEKDSIKFIKEHGSTMRLYKLRDNCEDIKMASQVKDLIYYIDAAPLAPLSLIASEQEPYL